MPFMGDTRRRQLRRLSTKSNTHPSIPAKDSTKHERRASEALPVVRHHRSTKSEQVSGTRETPTRPIDVPSKEQRVRTESQNNVDVFAFMEEEEAIESDTEQADSDVPSLSSSGSSTSSRSEHSPPRNIQSPYSDLEVHPADGKTGLVWYDSHRRDSSLHSDSGVSMLSSPIEESPILGHKSVPTSVGFERPNTHHNGVASGLMTTAIPRSPARHSHVPSLDLQLMDEPEAYYTSSPRMTPQTPRTATAKYPQSGLQPTATWQPSPHQSSPGSASPPSKAQVQMEKSGYDLLASAIDTRDKNALTPIYRKFETLNNRILLHLQDEIAELEDVLKRLDTAIAQEEGQAVTSRRNEALYPSQAKWQRQELMGRIIGKVEQYNSALSSYSNLTKSLEPASRADISAYKAWTSKHAPLADHETDFLHSDADLMTVSRPATKIHPAANKTPLITAVMALVSTVLIFSVVPQFLARIVVSLVIGFAGLCAAAPDVLSNMAKFREAKRMICTYAALMFILALAVG